MNSAVWVLSIKEEGKRRYLAHVQDEDAANQYINRKLQDRAGNWKTEIKEDGMYLISDKYVLKRFEIYR